MRFHETLSSNTKSSSADVVLQKSYQLTHPITLRVHFERISRFKVVLILRRIKTIGGFGGFILESTAAILVNGQLAYKVDN